MPYGSVLEVIADIEEIGARFAEVAGVVDPTALTHEDAETLRSGMDGIRTDGAVVLTELDATQEETLVVVDDGALFIETWRWRRGTRRALMQMLGKARAVQDAAQQVIEGMKIRVVVTKQGETLQRIASRELGDWREWPRLLAANPGVSAGEVPSGTTLVIPEKR